jgi:rhamnosyltransferase
VFALVVTYHPPPEILENIAALRTQVSSIVVVDNGSSESELETLRAARSKYDIELIENGRNLGIATALNAGVRKARAQDADWVALFDQDSRVEPRFISRLLESVKEAPNPAQIGIVCPIYFDQGTALVTPVARSKTGAILAAMTSGSVIRTGLFDQLGGFNESLFIDYVDIEFCLRTRRAGYSIFQCQKAVLQHSQGRITRHCLLGRCFGTTNHSAARRYYITRNRLWVLCKFLKDWDWSRQEMKSLITETAKMLLVEKDRFVKLKGVTLGFFDAFRGRLGYRCNL